MRHVLRSQQFDEELLLLLFERAADLQTNFDDPRRHRMMGQLLAGSMLFNVFYEPSTRTRMSFAAAAQHLGMQVVTTENAREFSSSAKGETLEDSIRVMCEYRPDVIVLRHHEDGAAERAAVVSGVPVINAGDGGGQHPTQALLDLYTIKHELERISNLHLLIGGDLARGRTARSLAYLISKFPGNRITFVSPRELSVGEDIKQHLSEHEVPYSETEELRDALPEADVVYWTRTQLERHKGQILDPFVLGVDELALMKQDTVLLHPLPRIGEITVEVDSDPRAAYFRQAGNGMFVRMALIEWVLELLAPGPTSDDSQERT
ncbi:aspartate carbamoyltransferase [Candidatus Parcubacteria bacterium]|nr:aspartate carbamoyltransferase [Candidatus Parcubacteria bacterium]